MTFIKFNNYVRQEEKVLKTKSLPIPESFYLE